tara:strand:+ start:107 stop:406 length:300 start_codon:yes stop_codon:yes gene_type:complete
MEQEERKVRMRVLSAILWLPAFYILTNMIIGGIVGSIAGSATTTYEAGHQAGQQASIEFFGAYGVFIIIAQLIVFSALSYFGKLPGVSKYKKYKKAQQK